MRKSIFFTGMKDQVLISRMRSGRCQVKTECSRICINSRKLLVLDGKNRTIRKFNFSSPKSTKVSNFKYQTSIYLTDCAANIHVYNIHVSASQNKKFYQHYETNFHPLLYHYLRHTDTCSTYYAKSRNMGVKPDD